MSDALKKTLLNAWHFNAKAKMVPFGGWEMPVEYPTGIFKEHIAVRAAAGVFDVTHMSALDVRGPNALAFLEAVLPNSPTPLKDGEAQYGYLLKPDGIALDDLYVYRLNAERYLVVVNASNTQGDLDWLHAINSGKGSTGLNQKLPSVEIRDLRDAGPDSLLDVAFQGPLTIEILAELADGEINQKRIRESRFNQIFPTVLKGIPVLASRTGYTGEEIAFELFVHPKSLDTLWNMLLEQGKSRGVIPCGLGARDSLRIEAGLPLFGHELEGSENLSLSEVGYDFVLKLDKPEFIGKEAYLKRTNPRAKRLLRLKGSGRKSVRGGQALLDGSGKAVGVVTSFAFTDPEYNFYVLAAVDSEFQTKAGTPVKAARCTPAQVETNMDASKLVDLTVATRFPTKKDKAAWKEQYSKYK